MKKIVISLFLLFATATHTSAAKGWHARCETWKGAPASCINSLVEHWRSNGPPRMHIVGYDLSMALASYPEEFLNTMGLNGDVFDGWLDELRFHTFRVDGSTASIRSQLEEAGLIRLRELMITAVHPYVGHDARGKLASAVLAKLKIIRVTYPGEPLLRPVGQAKTSAPSADRRRQ